MTCGTCIRWAKRPRPRLAAPNWATRYGFCRWPGIGPEPYWRAEHPEGYLMLPDVAGAGCPAFRERKVRR